MPPTPNRRIHEEARLQGRRLRLDGTSATAISAAKSLTPESRLTSKWLDAYAPRIGERIVMAVNWGGARVTYSDESKTFDAGKEVTFENYWIPNRASSLITIRLTPLSVER